MWRLVLISSIVALLAVLCTYPVFVTVRDVLPAAEYSVRVRVPGVGRCMLWRTPVSRKHWCAPMPTPTVPTP